jgi:hypothetical protein
LIVGYFTIFYITATFPLNDQTPFSWCDDKPAWENL